MPHWRRVQYLYCLPVLLETQMPIHLQAEIQFFVRCSCTSNPRGCNLQHTPTTTTWLHKVQKAITLQSRHPPSRAWTWYKNWVHCKTSCLFIVSWPAEGILVTLIPSYWRVPMLLGLQITLQTHSSSERELISRGEASVPLGVNGTTGSWIRTSDLPIARRTPYPLGQHIGWHISVPEMTNVPILGTANSNSIFKGLFCI